MNTQYSLIPKWLDFSMEERIKDVNKRQLKLNNKGNELKNFVVNSLRSLFKMGLSSKQAFELTAFMLLKSGAKNYNFYNLARWKITENFVQNYKVTHGGKSPRWYVFNNQYYRAFSSMDDFYSNWISVFLAKRTSIGDAFWKEGNWISLYSKENEIEKEEFEKLFAKMLNKTKTVFIQHVLGLEVNGSWNETTKKSVREFQQHRNLEPTNELTEEVVRLLLEKWKSKSMK